MGSGAKAQVAGYFYYLGMHLIACHGPADFVSHILADDKIAWSGYSTGGPLVFFNTNLFGGPDKEGGLAGRWDIEMGKSDQPVNPYLALKLAGNLVPAFRGVVGFVAWQNYVGTTTYLKKLAFRISRIHVRTSQGIAQWYDAKAQIGAIWSRPQSFMFALDCSASMDEITSNGQTRLTNAKNAVASVIDYLIAQKTTGGDLLKIDIDMSGWGTFLNNVRYFNAGLVQLNNAKSHVLSLTSSGQGGTDFRVAANGAQSFFTSPSMSAESDKSFFFMTDGEPDIGGELTPIQIAQQAATTIANTIFLTGGKLKSFCFNIDLDNTDYTAMLDTTPGDAVPVISGNNPIPLFDAIVGNLQGQLDMNPAHIIRECLTDPDWGMGYPESDIDDVAFTAAADKLYSEAMGMSLLWTKQITIEEFIKQVMKHIDATLYVDMNSGKFVLKLIRDDYDINTLIVLDENNVDHISDVKTPTFGELTNSVTVQFWDSEKYRDSSLTVQDSALADMQQAVINTTVDYSGFTNATIASRVGQRDLKTLSTPLLSCTIYANRDAAELNIGHVFKFSWADYGIVNLPMRVVGIAFGDGKRNQVRLTATQDVFSLPEVPVISPEPPYVPPNIDPIPVVYRLPYEVPYLEAVQQQGQAAIDALLVGDDGASFVGIAGERPNSAAISADMQVDSGSGYAHGADINFCPTAVLDEDIDQMATSFAIRDIVELDNGQGGNNIPDGTWFQMGTELMVKVSLVGLTLTVKRGVLDTVPVEHATDEKLFFWDTLASNSPVQYTEGNTVNVKMLPRTFNGVLNINAAPADALTFQGRLFRPYPPGNFRINGFYFPVDPVTEDLTVSWTSRNRRQQTGADIVSFTDGSITPEPGTTYRVIVKDRTTPEEFLNTTTSDLSLPISFSSMASWSQFLTMHLYAERDGVQSYQAQEWMFEMGEAPTFVFTDFSVYPLGIAPVGWSFPWGESSGATITDTPSPGGAHYFKFDTASVKARRAAQWDGKWASNDVEVTAAILATGAVVTDNSEIFGIISRIAGTSLATATGVRSTIEAAAINTRLVVGQLNAGTNTAIGISLPQLETSQLGSFAVKHRLEGDVLRTKAWHTTSLTDPGANEPPFWQMTIPVTVTTGVESGLFSDYNNTDLYAKSFRLDVPSPLQRIEAAGFAWPSVAAIGNTNSVTFSMPRTLNVGDRIVICFIRRQAITSSMTGWTLLQSVSITDSVTTQIMDCYTKTAVLADTGGTLAAPKTFTVTTTADASNRVYGILAAFTCSDGDIIVKGSAQNTATGVTGFVPPSLVADHDDSIGLVFGQVVLQDTTGQPYFECVGTNWQQLGVRAAVIPATQQTRQCAGIKRLTNGSDVNDATFNTSNSGAVARAFAGISVILHVPNPGDFTFDASAYTPNNDFIFS